MRQIESDCIKELTARFFEKELGSYKVSIVDFWAPWCNPCKKIGAIIESVAQAFSREYQGKIGFFKVNADKETSLVQKYGVMALPTVLAFSRTVVLDKYGGRTREDFEKWVRKVADRLD